MIFLGRKKELDRLNKEYQRDSSFVVVYGRRRVGKTTLIREFIKDKKALYFLAGEETDRQNLDSFTEKLRAFTGNDILEGARYEHWRNAFKTFANSFPSEKKVLVIDEFQYLVSSNPAFSSIFQQAWDEFLNDKNIMVILCGSLISMMTSQVLSHSSPLYGRRTAQIRLQPLSFEEFSLAFPDRSFQERVELYSVTGGVPKYMEFFMNDDDIWDNISENILDKSGFLYEEPIFLLEKEVRETLNYFSIMRALSLGNHKPAEIATVLEQKSTALMPYLSVLIELHLVERRIPVTEENPEKSKMGLYYINDHFIDFWFKFVYPNRGELEFGNIEYVMTKIKCNFIDNHVSFVFEDISRDYFMSQCRAQNVGFMPSKIGSLWNKHEQIDVCAVDNDSKTVFLGECKYYEKPVPADVYFDLVKKTSSFPALSTNNIIYGVFSKSGFENRLVELAKGNEQLMLFDMR